MASKRGVISRPLPSWLMRDMQGGRVDFPATAGRTIYAELFNDDQQGRFLYVWGLIAATGNPCQIVIETYKGKKQTTAGFQGPLWAGSPQSSGIVGSHLQTACIGTEIGAMISYGNSQCVWPYNFPVAVLPKGYSLGVHSSIFNTFLGCGFWWHRAKEV